MATRINGPRIERETHFGEFLKILRTEGTPAYAKLVELPRQIL
ncbi:MAG: hypothetical protein QGH42_02340 [Kiritimatiellia bacterium]|jgi:hypothetical protein|nr:hypothetical protein [Kiritimatiellia bacterium]MDP6811069.1 hypothetical protein [Kiritimatiellia bacterium]MDP7023076.1 hypothetical protein [Kiritimatiellia bacterium]